MFSSRLGLSLYLLARASAQNYSGCAAVTCGPGYACDPWGSICVAISCEAQNACNENSTCVDAEMMCIREPCPQFTCTSEELSCVSSCGIEYAFGEEFKDDGENYCNSCVCGANGKQCTEKACSPDEVLSKCATCYSACGMEYSIGEEFEDDGYNYCNDCVCEPRGKVCTEKACDLDWNETFCPYCKSECGAQYSLGDSFQDDGDNHCNSCVCGMEGKYCTQMACFPDESASKCPVCKSTCGVEYGLGVSFQDDGSNYCNVCVCESTGPICTLIACEGDEEPSKCPEAEEPPAPARCTSECGVPHGLGSIFYNDGNESCNICFCGFSGSVCTSFDCDEEDSSCEV